MNVRSHPPEACRRVLLVEDETRLREMLLGAMEEMHFQAAGAGSGESALRLLDQKPFDIAVLDLNLPGMSGLELFERIHERWPKMGAIILTGFGDLDAARQAIHLDVVDFLTKPCALRDLEIALYRARERRLADWKRQDAPAPIDEPHSPATFNPIPAGPPTTLDNVEREHILAVLKKHNGNRNDTAAELGISVRKLYYRLVEYQKQGITT
jgi:DNA-binding NtrC family response regulator